MTLSFQEAMQLIIEEMAGDNHFHLTPKGNYVVNKLSVKPSVLKMCYRTYEWDISVDTLNKIVTFYNWYYEKS